VSRNHILFSVFLFILPIGWESPDPPLPGDDVAPGWKRSGRFRHFVESDLYNHIDGGAVLFHEFGFREVFVQRYAKGSSEIIVEMYRMQDATASLGIYLLKAGKESPLDSVAARHSADRFGLVLVRGEWFIQVLNPDGDPAVLPAVRAFIALWVDQIKVSSDSFPGPALPTEGLVDGSIRLFRGPYALESIYTFGSGDILSQDRTICGIAADYIDETGVQTTRLFVPYASDAEARSAYRFLISHLDPYITPLESDSTALIFRDYQSEYGIVKLEKDQLDIRIHLLEKPALDSL
jgi:hypothetical protein